MKLISTCLILLMVLGGVSAVAAPSASVDNPWYQVTADGGVTVDLYFFWSRSCPHCQRARPDVERLAEALPWLRLHSHEISGDVASAMRYRRMALALGQEATSVPGFLFCNTMETGYDEQGLMADYLRERLVQCHASLQAGHGFGLEPETAQQLLDSAGLGQVDAARLSLPAVTLIIAGLDAFNPCAFFVLLFLLSLLVHAGGRGRMLLVGGVFVAVSGLVYFALMAAWLNVFLLVGQLSWVTLAAGVLAVIMALINIKDFLRPGQGPSLSIPSAAKPSLYQRVRGLLQAERLPALLLGTVLLAAAANSYELLCTAGFPMLYTRLLTLHQLPVFSYYLYLALYNLIYVLPLLVIVTVFSYTLGARKLQAREGRLLKLLSGTMMLGLGAVLLLAPERLGQLWVAAALLGAAVLVTAVAWWRLRGAGR